MESNAIEAGLPGDMLDVLRSFRAGEYDRLILFAKGSGGEQMMIRGYEGNAYVGPVFMDLLDYLQGFPQGVAA